MPCYILASFAPISVPLMHAAPMHTSWYKLAVFCSSFVSSQMGPCARIYLLLLLYSGYLSLSGRFRDKKSSASSVFCPHFPFSWSGSHPSPSKPLHKRCGGAEHLVGIPTQCYLLQDPGFHHRPISPIAKGGKVLLQSYHQGFLIFHLSYELGS